LRVALSDRFAALWLLAATTGMRRSELAGVDRDLLDVDAGTLTIADTRVVVNGYTVESDGKDRRRCPDDLIGRVYGHTATPISYSSR